MSSPQSIDPAGRDDAAVSNSQIADGSPQDWFGLPQVAWIRIGVVTALFAALFWPNLRRLWDKTNPFYGEANWGHAIGVPIIGLYYLYVNRELLLNPPASPTRSPRNAGLRVWGMLTLAMLLTLALSHELAHELFRRAAILTAIASAALFVWLWFYPTSKPARSLAERSSSWFGGFIVVWGIALFGYGIYPGQNDFVKDFGMVVTLFGVVLALTGWGVMRTAWFPVVFLICAIPWPGLLYSQIAGPLQQLAASVAVKTLELTGVEAHAGGTKIFIAGHNGVMRTLNVAEACAGLRSLMTFIAVGGAVAFLSGRALWQKILITLSAIPIAIFCNVMRVSGQGLLDHYVSQQLSENFAHQFVGMIMLVPAFLLILLVGWILDQIFVEEADQRRGVSRVVRRSVALVAPPPAAGGFIRRASSPVMDRVPVVPPRTAPPKAPAPKPILARPATSQRPAGKTGYPMPPPTTHLAPRLARPAPIPPAAPAKPAKPVNPAAPKPAAPPAASRVSKPIPPDSKREAV